MEAQTLTLSSRAKPRDLLCALTSNKGHLWFATARRIGCLGQTNFLVKTCEPLVGPLFGIKAHSRSLGFARDDKVGVCASMNVFAYGWVEPRQRTNLNKIDSQPSLRDSTTRGSLTRRGLRRFRLLGDSRGTVTLLQLK